MTSSYYEKIGNKVKNIDNEIPLEMPDGWVFVRLKELWDLFLDVILYPLNIVPMELVCRISQERAIL